MRGNLWTVVVIACVLALALPAVNIAFGNAATDGSATENATIDYSENYTLENSDVYEFTSLDVTANGSALSEPTDYVFDPGNGTIDWQDTAITANGDTATINYSFRDHDQTTKNQAGILSTLTAPLGLLLLMFVLGYLLVVSFRDPY